ncbi:MAG: hypothetical protein Q8Q08_00675 [Candidatus Omnitrophota bacterium]|nr:hypothetical protein [Candidatus Omnitrophota bacterium]
MNARAGEPTALTRETARETAEATAEAHALYGLRGGSLKQCIEVKVLRPCETDWVTCIDHAWVVQFAVGEACGILHDGRLGLHLLINEADGRIISRYPEVEYFQGPEYCMADHDCVLVEGAAGSGSCKNFIHGPLADGSAVPSSRCLCRQNICGLELEP